MSALRIFLIGAWALFLGSGVSRAQTGPAGNTHPQQREMSVFEGGNPFGEPAAATVSIQTKLAFSRQVDLGPLRDLAVFHDGRVKILDTLARETVSSITNRKRYVDFVPIGDAKNGESVPAKKSSYDPVFTFLDMMIDPAYYADKPLIHVDYPPLREAFLAPAFDDAGHREWWKKQGRLSPLIISDYARQVIEAHTFEPIYRRGIDRMSDAMGLYKFGWRNLMMLAPATPQGEWAHLSTLDPANPIAIAAHNLGEAWRRCDAAAVNGYIKTIAGALPQVNSANYPSTRREIERMYNAANPFEYGFWLYFLALLLLLLAFGTGRRWLVWTGVATLLAALSLHAFGFTTRCIIAERLAIQNQFESMTGLSLFAAVVGTVIMILRRQWLFGAAAAGVGFLVLITATQTGIPGHVIEREAPILNTSVLLKYHVTTVLTSYGLISLGFVLSLFYLATYYAAKLRAKAAGTGSVALAGGGFVDVSASALNLDDAAPKGTQRVLADLDTAQMIVLQLAFWGLGVGILLGAWWADHSWGRWWAFDPKELWALITWIVYLVVIHVRLVTKRRALWTAWLSVLGFFVMLWTYFGVNLLLPGLHAYA
jgi:cytochrome c-type biogenesis protein CcsB